MGALATLGMTLLSATVITSVNSVVPVSVLAGLLSLGFFIRFAGISLAIRQGRWGMGWGPRIASWIPFGLAAVLIGLAGAIVSAATFGAFLVLDTIGGFVKRDGGLPSVRPVRKRAFPWALVALVLYVGLVAAFHAFVGRYFPFGVLLTWSLLALGFSGYLLVALRGPKATEAHLLPPFDHRRHERREERVADPQRQRAEEVLAAFRARGDAGPFLDLVRQAAASADLKMEDVAALEERILHSFARAGTDRDQDVRAALDEVERLLALRRTPA